MNANPETDAPSVVGVRVRPIWSMVLYGLLVLSAGIAFYAQRSPGVDPAVARLSPWVFLAFVFGFAFYRVALVAARRYSPFKAFIQVFLAALFFLLLLFPRVQSPVGRPLLNHPDVRVRAQAAELAGFKQEQAAGPQLVRLLDDGAPEVREAAHQALVKLNAGADLGPADSAEARAAWGARFP